MKNEIVKNIHDKLDKKVCEITPFERVLIEFSVEETLKEIKRIEAVVKNVQ